MDWLDRPVLFLLALFLLIGTGTGQASPVQSNFTDSGQSLGGNADSSDVALGDLDGDGDPDAVVASYDGSSLVYINQGGAQGGAPGVFLESGQALSESSANDVALADLDGDGDLDVFITKDAFSDSNEVFINQGGAQNGTPGTFAFSGQVFGDQLSTSIALGDLDGANGPDAFVGRTFGQASKVWLNNGSGTFSDSGQSLDTDSSDLALGDLDGDGDLDATSANGGDNRVWVNQGGAQMGTPGTFLDSGQVLTSTLSLAVSLGDLDGDVDLDAWVGNSGSDRLWVNQGGDQGGTEGVFAQGAVTSSGQTRDVSLGDLDGDGDLDAFLAKTTGNEVWINQGGEQGGTEGVFVNSLQSLGSSLSEGLDLADVDGDGDLDAFVANWGAPDKVWLNQAETPGPVGEGWQVSHVATRGQAGLFGDLALDSSDSPHIIEVEMEDHVSGKDYSLQYGYWDGVRWHFDLVDQVQKIGDLDGYSALALDSAGNPHVAYAAGPSSLDLQLRYASRNGSEWQIQELTSLEYMTGQVAMVLDSGNRPHIAFFDRDTNSLLYTHWTGSTWQQDTVTNGLLSNVVAYQTITLDAQDLPNIAFYDSELDSIRVAHFDGQDWSFTTVNSVNDNPFDPYTDIRMTPTGEPALAYVWGVFSEEIHYAVWDGTQWINEIALSIPNNDAISERITLDFDTAGQPHIGFARDTISGKDFHHLYRDGGGWHNELLDNNGMVGRYAASSVDSQDHFHAIYYSEDYADLRYVHWGPDWEIRSLTSGSAQSPVIQLKGTVPSIGYSDITGGWVGFTQWLDAWNLSPAGVTILPVHDVSYVAGRTVHHLAYYDPDNTRLLYARYNGTSWTTIPLDETADVGRYVDLTLIGSQSGRVRAAYWDATFNRVKVAALGGFGPSPVTFTNTIGPALDADSGYTHLTVLAQAQLGISYYDGASDDLRYATLDVDQGIWTDELVDAAGDVGRYNDIATDQNDGYPVIAYYDASSDAIKLAVNDGAWQIVTAVPNAGGVVDLALELGLGSRTRARILYATASDQLKLAVLKDGSWNVENVYAGTLGLEDVSLALDDRAHSAFNDGGGLFYAFRSASLDVDVTLPEELPPPTAGAYNPLNACAAVLELFFGSSPVLSAPGSPMRGPSNHGIPVDDAGIFSAMASIFSGTSGGQYYVDLYAQHGQEMGQIGLDDPALMWDAAGTLQNFLPGLESFVQGRGGEVRVTQQMVDDALDIWQRIAAAGSPTLAADINSELAGFNNLQDFVGMTFDEWALAIGVQPPQSIFLPIIVNGQ